MAVTIMGCLVPTTKTTTGLLVKTQIFIAQCTLITIVVKSWGFGSVRHGLEFCFFHVPTL